MCHSQGGRRCPALELLRDSPGRGVAVREAKVGGGGLVSTVLLSRLGRVVSTLSSHSVYRSSSNCFMERATAR